MSEYVYRGRVVTLRIDTIIKDGREIRREIVEHHGAVAIVPRLDAETVLLIRQFRPAVGESLLEIPAGTCESDEDADATANRELEEEIGYRAEKLTRMFSQYLAPGYSSEVLHAYLGEDLVESRKPGDEDEAIEIVPVKIEDIERLILEGEIKDAKSIAALLVAKRLL
jgi:ADP-ribose pyrophosphatase